MLKYSETFISTEQTIVLLYNSHSVLGHVFDGSTAYIKAIAVISLQGLFYI